MTEPLGTSGLASGEIEMQTDESTTASLSIDCTRSMDKSNWLAAFSRKTLMMSAPVHYGPGKRSENEKLNNSLFGSRIATEVP